VNLGWSFSGLHPFFTFILSILSFDMLKSQKERDLSSALLGAAIELRNRSAGLNDALKLKERDAALAREFSNQIEHHLRATIQECESGRLPPDQALQSLVKSSRGALNYSRSLGETALADARQLKGYIEGFSAAVELVSGMGASLLHEAEKIEALAASDVNLDQKRSTGERPETLRVKRKAAALRSETESDEGTDTPAGE
jgi:hypothetical protein